ncbi:MAG: single-strand binding protein/Primosomal replication protein n [Burkholderiales bacterium]|jgi:primosomal replication protein N|nr:single-strand binding protein/Primosomal replication protein n [Burkholderiales bacterium]
MICSSNQSKLGGLISQVYPMRQTPSGVNIARFILEHSSTQVEAGSQCRIKCKMFCIWVNPVADMIEEGKLAEVSGFISQNAKLQLVLHVNECIIKS